MTCQYPQSSVETEAPFVPRRRRGSRPRTGQFRAAVSAFPIAVLLFMLTGCARWHEFHSVQPYAGIRMPPPPGAASVEAPLVVVLAGSEGTEVFDLLAPYAILAGTGALDVRIAAREASPLPIWRGLALRPHATLAQLDADGRTPVAIVVPNFTDADQPAIDDWLRRHAAAGSWLLSVCEGAEHLARTGLLDDRLATSHSSALGRLMKTYPSVLWARRARWTGDGRVITTAGVSAATEGALVLVERLLGVAAREQAMRRIHYPYAEISMLTGDGIRTRDQFRLARRALFGGTGRVAVVLEDGVDELLLGATLDTWARLFPRSLRTVAANDGWVTTRHGLTVGPTARWSALRDTDEIVTFSVSGAEARDARASARMHLLDRRRYPFGEMARIVTGRYGRSTTEAVFRTMDLPLDAAITSPE